MIRQSRGGFTSSEWEFRDQGEKPGDEGQAGRGSISWMGLRSGEPAVPPEWIWGINYCSSFAENELIMTFYEKHKPSRLAGKSSLRNIPRVPPGTVDPGATVPACPTPAAPNLHSVHGSQFANSGFESTASALSS